jgi:hypothetical protein
MKNKKFLPLVILVGVVALLGILLAVLTLHGEAETDTTLPLCDLAVDDIDALSYAGNNVEVSLLKGSDGWLLADDPSLPLDQTKVQSLVEDYANLKAQRKLEGNDLAELPAKSDTPQMTITLGAGEQTVDLTVDQLNSVADVYYVYDESGAAYTVRRSDLATLSKSPRDLYKAQTLTDSSSATTQYHCLSLLSSRPSSSIAGTGMPSGPPVHCASLRSAFSASLTKWAGITTFTASMKRAKSSSAAPRIRYTIRSLMFFMCAPLLSAYSQSPIWCLR